MKPQNPIMKEDEFNQKKMHRIKFETLMHRLGFREIHLVGVS